MKHALTLLFCSLAFIAEAQDYSSLIGKTYTSRKELTVLKNCFQVDAKTDPDQYTYRHFFDSATSRHIIFVEKETAQTTYKILDLIELGHNKENLIIIGQNRVKKWEDESAFIIAVECCYQIRKKDDWPTTSADILHAWLFNKKTLRLDKINPKKISRIGRAYY